MELYSPVYGFSTLLSHHVCLLGSLRSGLWYRWRAGISSGCTLRIITCQRGRKQIKVREKFGYTIYMHSLLEPACIEIEKCSKSWFSLPVGSMSSGSVSQDHSWTHRVHKLGQPFRIISSRGSRHLFTHVITYWMWSFPYKGCDLGLAEFSSAEAVIKTAGWHVGQPTVSYGSIPYQRFCTQMLCFYSSSLLMHLWKHQKLDQGLWPLPPTGVPTWSSRMT